MCKMQFYVYKVVLKDKNADEVEVNLNDDLVNFRWANIDNLKNVKLTPPSLDLFKKLGYI